MMNIDLELMELVLDVLQRFAEPVRAEVVLTDERVRSALGARGKRVEGGTAAVGFMRSFPCRDSGTRGSSVLYYKGRRLVEHRGVLHLWSVEAKAGYTGLVWLYQVLHPTTGECLYVGQTEDLVRRHAQHKRNALWYHTLGCELTPLERVLEGQASEREAHWIGELKPKYNTRRCGRVDLHWNR